jgi:hypothetical protein
MVFYFQMTAFVDDDVFDIFRRQMYEIEIEREFLIVSTASSFGTCFSDVYFFVRYS